MPTVRCPRCDGESTTGGLIPGSRGGGPVCFIPDGCRKAGFWFGVRFRDAEFFACSSCGLVWSELPPDELRAHIEKHGNESAKSRLPKAEIPYGEGDLA